MGEPPCLDSSSLNRSPFILRGSLRQFRTSIPRLVCKTCLLGGTFFIVGAKKSGSLLEAEIPAVGTNVLRFVCCVFSCDTATRRGVLPAPNHVIHFRVPSPHPRKP